MLSRTKKKECKNSFPKIYLDQIYSQLYELCAELAFCVKICVKRPCMRVPVSCVDSPCVISVSCVENWVYIWQNLVTKTEGCTVHTIAHTLDIKSLQNVFTHVTSAVYVDGTNLRSEKRVRVISFLHVLII
jgi:hypothetical protein